MVGLYGLHIGFEPEPLMAHYAQFMPTMPADIASGQSGAVFERQGDQIRAGMGFYSGETPRAGTAGIIASCLGAFCCLPVPTGCMKPADDEIDAASRNSRSKFPIRCRRPRVEPSIELQEEDMPDDNDASAAVLPGGQSAVGVEPGTGAAGERSLDGLTALIEKRSAPCPKSMRRRFRSRLRHFSKRETRKPGRGPRQIEARPQGQVAGVDPYPGRPRQHRRYEDADAGRQLSRS